MTAKNPEIINWNNVFAHDRTFQEKKPTKWAFIEEFFASDFYEKLYETYPKKMTAGFLKPLMINQLIENGGQDEILMAFQTM